jgi:hypothetical protein
MDLAGHPSLEGSHHIPRRLNLHPLGRRNDTCERRESVLLLLRIDRLLSTDRAGSLPNYSLLDEV